MTVVNLLASTSDAITIPLRSAIVLFASGGYPDVTAGVGTQVRFPKPDIRVYPE